MLTQAQRKCFGKGSFGFLLFQKLIRLRKMVFLGSLGLLLSQALARAPPLSHGGRKEEEGKLWKLVKTIKEGKVLHFTHSTSVIVAWYFKTIWNNESQTQQIVFAVLRSVSLSVFRWGGRHWRLWRKCWCYPRTCWMSEIGNWIFHFWKFEFGIWEFRRYGQLQWMSKCAACCIIMRSKIR